MKNKERIEKNMDEQEMRITHTRKIHAGGGVQNTAISSERRMLSREDSILFIESGKKRGECL